MSELASRLPLDELLSRVTGGQLGGRAGRSGTKTAPTASAEDPPSDRRSDGDVTPRRDVASILAAYDVPVYLVLPEQEGTPGFQGHRDELNTICGVGLEPFSVGFDSDDWDAERKRYERETREEGVWEMAPLTPEQQAKVAASKLRHPDYVKPVDEVEEEDDVATEREVVGVSDKGFKIYAPTWECKEEGCEQLEHMTRGPDAGYCRTHVNARRATRSSRGRKHCTEPGCRRFGAKNGKCVDHLVDEPDDTEGVEIYG